MRRRVGPIESVGARASQIEALFDLLDNRGRRSIGIDDEGVTRFFQAAELAGEETGTREVSRPVREPTRQYRFRGLEIDEPHVRVILAERRPIPCFERRAGDHERFVTGERRSERGDRH